MQLEVYKHVAATRILLVDDFPDALEIWGLYLRALGYEVVEADDGSSGDPEELAQLGELVRRVRGDQQAAPVARCARSGHYDARSSRNDPETTSRPSDCAATEQNDGGTGGTDGRTVRQPP